MLLQSLFILFLAWAATASRVTTHYADTQKRDDTVCTDLSVSSNNGDRKVAIVIDSSGSMASNDFYDLRIKAGRALNEFLISSGEASGGQKADLVTVIDFDDTAHLDYPLGDPSGANGSFSKIDSSGGTYIASGVLMAIDQLTGGGGTTDKRSAIVIFTDGEDYYTDQLVDAINNATAAGIRVSFGYLDTSVEYQPPAVLTAVKNSRGVYATITVAAGSQNYINYVLLNGLTYNDNPQGYDSQLLAGLAETHFITSSGSVTLKYSAQQGENVNFTITSISAGELDVTATMGGQTLNSTQVTLFDEVINVQAPSTGEMDLKITASAAPQDAMFSVTTNSNVPFKNCTVGVTGATGSGGLSSGAKAGVGVGVTAALVGILGLGGYFLYKHFFTGGMAALGSGGVAAPAGGQGGLQYFPGAEKAMPQTGVYSVDPSSGGMSPAANSGPMSGGPGQAPMSGGPGQAPMSGPPGGSNGLAPASGSGGLPAANVAAPMSMAAPPPGSVPPVGGAPYSVAQPFAFVPPMAPPPPRGPDGKAPQEKMPGGTGDGSPQAQYIMSNIPPSGVSQQPMGPAANQPLSPGSPASQYPMGSGNGGYAAPPGSQGPMSYGPGNQPLSGGGQVPFGNGNGSFGPGSQYPMGSGGQAPMPGGQQPFSGPGSDYPSGPDGFHQNEYPDPNTYQSPMGTGSNPLGYDPHTGGPQQFTGPGGFQQPMGGGAEGFQHPMSGQGQAPMGEYGQAPMGSNPSFNNVGFQQPMGSNPGAFQQPTAGQGQVPIGSNPGINGCLPGQQAPMSPDSFNYSMSPDSLHAPGPSPYGPGSAPTISPNTTGGGDFYNHSTGTGGGDFTHPDPSNPQHPAPQSSAGGDWNNDHLTGDGQNHPTNDHHNPDTSSPAGGPDVNDGQPPTPGTAPATAETNPGFTMPAAPFRSARKTKDED